MGQPTPPSLCTRFAIVLGLCASALPAVAAEHVVLRNGFELDCASLEVVGTRTRLFTTADTANFLEVESSAILRTEPLAVRQLPSPAPSSSSAPSLSAGAAAAQTVSPRTAPVAAAGGADLKLLTENAGRTHNIDAALLGSIIRAESGGNARAVSRAGARGLMQLMPATAAALGVTDSFAPGQNIQGGAAYLDYLLTLYHNDIALAVAAYNAGPAAVARWHGIPPYRETRLYVARVISEFNRRKLAGL